MAAKSSQLQIRVTALEKEAIRARANAAGMELSRYVLARALPDPVRAFVSALRAIENSSTRRFGLAALNDVLASLDAERFADVVSLAPGVASFLPLDANLVAAMVEFRAHQLGVAPPAWARWIAPLDTPWFAGGLVSLRAHLIAVSPVAFRRRNLFVDSTVGDRV